MELAWTERDVEQTAALLGGEAVLGRCVKTSMDAHDLLVLGVSSWSLFVLVKECRLLEHGDLLQKTVGISQRTLQRHRAEATSQILSPEQSSRVWRFAEIFAHAIAVMGSSDAAEVWMQRPAIGLDNRKPLDLLATSVGAEAVSDYLTRLEYGVYA